MEQRMSVLSIGADNLIAMREFYEKTLQWKPIAENNDIVFYKMNGFLFSIGKRKELANFIGINPAGNGFRGVTFGYNVMHLSLSMKKITLSAINRLIIYNSNIQEYIK